MTMVNNCRWNVPRAPSKKACTQAQIRIITKSEKRLVEAARLLEDLAMVKSSAGIRPQDFFRFIVLAHVRLHCAPAAILAVPVNQMARFVDHAFRVLKEDFAGEHADAARRVAITNQLLQPVRFCNCVSIEKRDPFAACLGKREVIRFTETAVIRKQDRLCVGQTLCRSEERRVGKECRSRWS